MTERWIYSVMSLSVLGFVGYMISLLFGFKENAKMVQFISVLTVIVITLQIIAPITNAVGNFFGRIDGFFDTIDKVALINSGGWDLPVSGGWISQEYKGKDHNGLDIAIPENTPVLASTDGIVSKTGWSDIYGQFIVVDYDNGIKVMYAHNKDILLQEGMPTIKNTVIAKSGNSGRSSGAHLHLQTYENDKIVSPEKFFRVP